MPGPAFSQKAGDRGIVADGAEQLDGALAHLQGDGLHPLVLEDLPVVRHEGEGSAVECEGLVQVGDGDAEMIDAGEHVPSSRPRLRRVDRVMLWRRAETP